MNFDSSRNYKKKRHIFLQLGAGFCKHLQVSTYWLLYLEHFNYLQLTTIHSNGFGEIF